MTVIKTRGHQLFPVLDASQIDTAKRFASGPARNFAPGEIVFDVGERHAVLKGSIDVVRRDGLNHEAAEIACLGGYVVTVRPRRYTSNPSPDLYAQDAAGPTPGALQQGDDYPLEYYPDGYPKLPACLDRRRPKELRAAA